MALRPGLCTALTQAVCDKLKSVSIRKSSDFITRDLEQLSQTLQLPYKDLCSIKRMLLAEHSAYPLSASTLYLNALSSIATLSTGFDGLDTLLDGGLFTGEMTELAGYSAAGKSTICHRAAAAAVRLGPMCVTYIDTCGSFSPEALLGQVVQLSSTQDAMSREWLESCLSRVKYVEALDIYQLFAALDTISSDLTLKNTEEPNSLRLVIVDNVATVVMPMVGGGAVHSQGLLSQLGAALKRLAVEFSLSVLVTNNMVASFNGSDKRAALGRAWSQMPHTRLIVEHGVQNYMCGQDQGHRRATLTKSCRQKTPVSTVFSLGGEDLPEG